MNFDTALVWLLHVVMSCFMHKVFKHHIKVVLSWAMFWSSFINIISKKAKIKYMKARIEFSLVKIICSKNNCDRFIIFIYLLIIMMPSHIHFHVTFHHTMKPVAFTHIAHETNGWSVGLRYIWHSNTNQGNCYECINKYEN